VSAVHHGGLGNGVDTHNNHIALGNIAHVWSIFHTELATDTSSPIPIAETLGTRSDRTAKFKDMTYAILIPNRVMTVTLVSRAMFNFHIVGSIPVARTASVMMFRTITGNWR